VDEYLKLNNKLRDGGIGDATAVAKEVVLLASRGDAAGAEKIAQHYLQKFSKQTPEAERKEVENYVQAFLQYGKGDEAGFGQRMVLVEDFEWKFFGLLSSKKLTEAAEALKSIERASAASHLLVSMEAELAGQKKLADEQYQLALESFRKGDPADRKLAAMLEAGQPPDIDFIADLSLSVGDEMILLTALGMKYPDRKDAYFDLARKLNFDPSYPYLLIRRVTG
jgi:hypothetical protein